MNEKAEKKLFKNKKKFVFVQLVREDVFRIYLIFSKLSSRRFFKAILSTAGLKLGGKIIRNKKQKRHFSKFAG